MPADTASFDYGAVEVRGKHRYFKYLLPVILQFSKTKARQKQLLQ